MTMTFEATPEILAFMRRWSDEVPTLYFLDICVTNATKLSLQALEKDTRKGALVTRLKELDKPQNSFSYLLALAEKVSDARGELTDTELEDQVVADVAALRAFFAHARVVEPDEFLRGYVRALRRMPHELSHDAYIRFLRAANDQFTLANPAARPRRLQKAKEILTAADALSIGRQHPVVLVTLGCLYGNSAAKKLMKFKADGARFNAENALADIMIISRLIPRKLEIEQWGREGKASFLRSDFLTDDDGLAGILKCFEGESVRSECKGNVHQTEMRLTVHLEMLFPEIGTTRSGAEKAEGSAQDEFEQLRELLYQ
jgi:hypothetical protein